MKIGYARISTGDQSLASQIEALRRDGCGEILEETGSGASRKRPVLSGLLTTLGPGDCLVVVRLDRVARSLSHLLEVIETVAQRGATFRSLSDPVDTGSPQGQFTLQILGAVAELERALIRERTKAGLEVARAEGRIGGNPKLKAMDARLRRQIGEQRRAAYFERVNASAATWVPVVRKLRPGFPWPDVAAVVNTRLGSADRPWTGATLKRAARRFVEEGLLSQTVLERAPATGTDRLPRLVAGLLSANPDLTLQQIGSALEAMKEHPPRGAERWWPSTVKKLRDRAGQMGLLAEVEQEG